MRDKSKAPDPITPAEVERERDLTEVSPAQPYGPGRIDASDVSESGPPAAIKRDLGDRMEN
ncbi:MAG: hypothetical protein ABSH03_14560 [Candidatus Lustribacter sp.]|jgi:hypothetical protein